MDLWESNGARLSASSPEKKLDEPDNHDDGWHLPSAAIPPAGPILSVPSPMATPGGPSEQDSLLIKSEDSKPLSPASTPSDNQTQAIQSNGQSKDLDSYIPVGVLWRNFDPEVTYPQTEITLLETHGWVRTEFSDGSNHLRVYVDYKMTSRSNTQRSITKLRTALKAVMSKIDRSRHAWCGYRDENSFNGNKSNSTEDDSLWYIFNTLQDPCPRVENMHDHWAQHAMEQLLSEDHFADLGLKTKLFPYQRRSAATMVQREAQPARMLDPRLQAYRTPTEREYYYDKEDAYITLDAGYYSEACGGNSISPNHFPRPEY